MCHSFIKLTLNTALKSVEFWRSYIETKWFGDCVCYFHTLYCNIIIRVLCHCSVLQDDVRSGFVGCIDSVQINSSQTTVTFDLSDDASDNVLQKVNVGQFFSSIIQFSFYRQHCWGRYCNCNHLHTSVCPSIRLFPLSLRNRLTVDIELLHVSRS